MAIIIGRMMAYQILRSDFIKRGFTIIELIAVIAIIGILISIASPRLKGHIEGARITKVKAEVKAAESLLEIEEVENGTDISYGPKASSSVVENLKSSGQGLSRRLYNKTGIVEDPDELKDYFYVNSGVVNKGMNRSDSGVYLADKDSNVYFLEIRETEDWIIDSKGDFRYTGSDKIVKIPERIRGKKVDSYKNMFSGTSVEKVIPNGNKVKDMGYMFDDSTARVLDVSALDTSSTTDISRMFRNTRAKHIFGLSELDTKEVTSMRDTFREAKAEEINIESFVTPNLRSTRRMFFRTQAKTLIFGEGFTTSKVEDMRYMFNTARVERLEGITSLNLSRISSTNEVINDSAEGDGSRQNLFYSSLYDLEHMEYWNESLKDGKSISITGEHKIIRKDSGSNSYQGSVFYHDIFEARNNRASGQIGLVKDYNVLGLGAGNLNPSIDILVPRNTNTSGRIRTIEKQGYGTYSADIVVPDNDRMLNGFFLYSYVDRNSYEIDIEIVKRRGQWKLWATIFNPTHPNYSELERELKKQGYNEPGAVFHHEMDLEVDPTAGLNNYKIIFEENRVSFEFNNEEFAVWNDKFDYQPMYLYAGTFYTHWLNRDLIKENFTSEEIGYIRSNGFDAYSRDGISEKMNRVFGDSKDHKMSIRNIVIE